MLHFYHKYQVFLKAYQPSSDSESNDIYIDIGEGTIKFTSNWLLNHLVIHLHQHMSYKCIHKKFGLYRKGGDPLISLSWAQARECDTTWSRKQRSRPTKSLQSTNRKLILEQAGCIINALIQNEIESTSNGRYLMINIQCRFSS